MNIEKQGKYTTYKNIKVIKGVLGDYATEWWNQEDWDKWNKQVAEWKADGTYGKVSYVNMTFLHNSMFDDPILKTNLNNLSSYRLIFLNND